MFNVAAYMLVVCSSNTGKDDIGTMPGSKKFCQRVSNIDNIFFVVEEGTEDT